MAVCLLYRYVIAKFRKSEELWLPLGGGIVCHLLLVYTYIHRYIRQWQWRWQWRWRHNTVCVSTITTPLHLPHYIFIILINYMPYAKLESGHLYVYFFFKFSLRKRKYQIKWLFVAIVMVSYLIIETSSCMKIKIFSLRVFLVFFSPCSVFCFFFFFYVLC